MTDATEATANATPLAQRRKLLRQFRKQYGITLVKFGFLCGISNPMLSQFEKGKRDLSAESWAHVLEAISKLVREGQGNLTRDPDKRLAGIAKAQKTAAKLGVAVAQSVHSETLGEQLGQYALMPPIQVRNYTPQKLAEMLRDVLEIAQRAVHESAIERDKARFYCEQLDKVSAQNVGLKDILALRDKKILTEEAEQQKIDALGLEKIPPVEERILREEIEQKAKRKTKPKHETEDDPFAESKAEHAADLRRIGFKEGDK